MPPTLIVVPNADALAKRAADLASSVIVASPNALLLPATGGTPMGTYADLAKRGLKTERLRVAVLDEYLGVERSDPRSLTAWLHRSFVAPLGIDPSSVIGFDPSQPDPVAYDAAIEAAGGIDLAILGLGPNGHLGFNEPPSDPFSPTRVVELAPESLISNARYFEDAVPTEAVTAGMNVIMAARQILLVVSGSHKQGILHRTLDGPITPDVPASFLRRHPDITVVIDQAARP